MWPLVLPRNPRCSGDYTPCFLLFNRQRLLQRTVIPDRLPTAIPFQQFVGPPGEHSANFPPLSFDPGNHHAVVAGRLVPHPGDHSGLGSLLDGNTLRPGDRAASDRRGVIGDGSCHPVGEISVFLMKAQERDHGPQKVIHILGLGLSTSAGIGFLAFGEALGGPLGFKLGTDAFDGCCRCPNAPGEDLPAFLLGHNPMVPSFLYTPSQCCVTRRQENPALRCGQDRAIGCSDGVCRGARRK